MIIILELLGLCAAFIISGLIVGSFLIWATELIDTHFNTNFHSDSALDKLYLTIIIGASLDIYKFFGGSWF